MNTIRTRTQHTLRHLRIALVGAAMVVITASALTPDVYDTTRGILPTATSTMIAAHGCWTGEAPANVTAPGHVVVTLPGEHHPTYGGAHLTGHALAQTFDGAHHNLTVHAYCR